MEKYEGIEPFGKSPSRAFFILFNSIITFDLTWVWMVKLLRRNVALRSKVITSGSP